LIRFADFARVLCSGTSGRILPCPWGALRGCRPICSAILCRSFDRKP
jgi:hypothetical protein